MIYLERALFVVGDQNDGKSSQIRDTFRDQRFHNNGYSKIGENGRLPNWVSLSNDRWLHIRLTSPHEYGEGFDRFIEKIDAMEDHQTGKYRWNFLCALQTNSFGNMPNSEDVVMRFNKIYKPERSEIALIHTGHGGKVRSILEIDRISSCCRANNIQLRMIDARIDNGLSLADFFDFS